MKELGDSWYSCLPWNHGCPHGRWYDFTLAGEFVPTMITATFEIPNLPNDQMVTSKVGRAGPLWRHANLLTLALRMVWWTPTISACWVPRWTWHLAVSGFQRLIDAHLLGPMCCLPSNREHRESYIHSDFYPALPRCYLQVFRITYFMHAFVCSARVVRRDFLAGHSWTTTATLHDNFLALL